MKHTGFLLMTIIICSGCVSRQPLRSLPEVGNDVLHLESKPEVTIKETAISAPGRNARASAAGEGLIGIITTELIAVSTKGNSVEIIKNLRKQSGYKEKGILQESVKAQLKKAGLAWTEQEAKYNLVLELNSVGLEEIQRGFWRVGAQVTATISDAKQRKIWKVNVSASSRALRSLDDFTKQPQLYVEDFAEAAEDATYQLVAGPIRK